jgi:hypothetical protein
MMGGACVRGYQDLKFWMLNLEISRNLDMCMHLIYRGEVLIKSAQLEIISV